MEDSHMSLALLRHRQTAQRPGEHTQGLVVKGRLNLLILKLLFALSCQNFLSMRLPPNRHIIFVNDKHLLRSHYILCYKIYPKYLTATLKSINVSDNILFLHLDNYFPYLLGYPHLLWTTLI